MIHIISQTWFIEENNKRPMGGQTEISQGIIFMNNQRKLEIFKLWNKNKKPQDKP